MKANEFVKKFGLEEAAEIVQGTPSKYMECYHSSVCWDTNTYKYSDRFKPRNSLVNIADLKRLIESYEFINERGGLEHVKNLIATKLHWFDVDAIIKTNQAIADVESCQ